MNFRLQKEKQEAERKRIEAAGIRDFQQIVAQGISPQLLEWKGIEATETLRRVLTRRLSSSGAGRMGFQSSWAVGRFERYGGMRRARKRSCRVTARIESGAAP